ncbi:hypothetical protein ACHAWF_009805, partial [Thalassiosira exigua]
VVLALASLLVLLSSSARLTELVAPDRPPALTSRDVDSDGGASLGGEVLNPDAPPSVNVASLSVSESESLYVIQNDIRENVTQNATTFNRLPDYPMPDNPRMYFIHVGKAGGFTLGETISLPEKKASLPCRMNKTLHNKDDSNCYTEPGASQFSLHVISHFHLASLHFTNEQKAWLLDNTNTFLYSIRDPIDRIISTFYFHKNGYATAVKKNTTKAFRVEGLPIRTGAAIFHEQCFSRDIGDLIRVLRYNGNDTNVTTCKELGETVIQGKTIAGGNHFGRNYQYYRDYSLGNKPNHSVAVIRMESMWDDIVQLDQMLGGSGHVRGMGLKHTHGSENYTSSFNKTLSAPDKIYLCCLIYEEIVAYQSLVLRAFNLNATQKEETISNLLDQCQINDIRMLPREIPFPWQLLYNKTYQCTRWDVLDL